MVEYKKYLFHGSPGFNEMALSRSMTEILITNISW